MPFLPRSLIAASLRFVVTNFVSLISVQCTKSSLTPLPLLSPKSLTAFWGLRLSWQSHIPFGSLFSFQGTMKRSFTYSHWEAASGKSKWENIWEFENLSLLFAQGVSKRTPVFGLFPKKLFEKFIPSPIPTGKSQMHTLNRKKFLPLHLFGIERSKRNLFFRKFEKFLKRLSVSKIPFTCFYWQRVFRDSHFEKE